MPSPWRKATAFSHWSGALEHPQISFYPLSFCCKDAISFVQPLLPQLPAAFVEEGTSDGEEEHGDPVTASLLTSMGPSKNLVQEASAWSKGAWMAFCRAWMGHGAARHIHTWVFCSGWSSEAGVEQAARSDLKLVSTLSMEAGFVLVCIWWKKLFCVQ